MGMYSHMAAAGLLAASSVSAQVMPPTPPVLTAELNKLSHICTPPEPFRAIAYILSTDAKRPGVAGITMGTLECTSKSDLADEESTRKLAYLLTQMMPAHVVDQVRTQRLQTDFSLSYQNTNLRAVLAGASVEEELVTNNSLMCYNYNYLAQTTAGELAANGGLKVCLALSRVEAGNLPVPDLKAIAAAALPQVRRSYTEPRDAATYGPR